MSGVQKTGWKAWLPVVSLSCAAFIFVTTEFLPIGLLTDIGRDLGQTESQTGLLLTGYAWVVAGMSLPLTILVARFERKTLLLTLLGLFIVAHVIAFLAVNIWWLGASRLLIALAHSVFWAIATPLAARVAPNGQKAYGLAIMVVGGSLATVLGVPLGTIMGHQFGWRLSFLVIGGVAAIIALIVFFLLPRLVSKNAGSLKSLPILLKRPELLVFYALTALAITGEFTAYTYIEPIVLKIGNFSQEAFVGVLFVFGLAGILGGFVNARFAARFPRGVLFAGLSVAFVSLLLLIVAVQSYVALLALAFFWGVFMTVVMLQLQLRIMALAPDAKDVAIAMFSGIFNVGIGSGALIGGQIANTSLGFGALGYVGSGFLAAALILAFATIGRRSFGHEKKAPVRA